VRSQFHHVIGVAPTVLEAASLPEPKIVNGTANDLAAQNPAKLKELQDQFLKEG
jgi:arylsulfatase A-like enzyme